MVCYIIEGGFEGICDVVYVAAAKSVTAVCWVNVNVKKHI